jgi:hypothetical protein
MKKEYINNLITFEIVGGGAFLNTGDVIDLEQLEKLTKREERCNIKLLKCNLGQTRAKL